MSFTSKQIEGFVPSGEINENSIVVDKSLGSDVSKIFEKQKKLRESLALLIQTCYEEIHEAADKRQKKIIEFNDKYLIQTILENVSTTDTKAIEDKIEELIIEKYVSLKVLDQAKLKGYVWKILNQGYEEYHKNDGSREIAIEDESQKSIQQTSIDIFKDTLSNENLMNGLLDRLGGRIIDSQGKFNDSLLDELGKLDVNSISNSNITKQMSPISNPKTVTEKLLRAQKRRIKREKRAEKRLLKKQAKQLNIQQGISDVIQSQMSQMEQLNNSLSSIGFGTSKKKKRFGFFRQHIRNIRAVGKKGKRKFTLVGWKFGMFKPKKAEQKSDKKKFLEMYNKMALKNLYSRIDEFDKGKIMSRHAEKSKRRLIASIGGFIWGFIKKIGKMVWNLGKFVLKSLWQVSKKIFNIVKIGFKAIISKLKWFIMTPAGAYITGFIAGLIWHGLIKPVIEWGKTMFKKLMEFFDFESLDDLMSQKEKIFKSMREEFTDFVMEHGGSIKRMESLLQNMEYLGSQLNSFEAKIVNFKEDTVGKVINTACTTVGIVVGSFFGPIGSIIGGALGKAVGMTAEYFYKQIPDGQEDTVKKNLIIEQMKKRYVTSSQNSRHTKVGKQISKINDDTDKLQNQLDTINDRLKDKKLNAAERQKLESDKKRYEGMIEENNKQKEKLLQLDDIGFGKEEQKLRDKYDYIFEHFIDKGVNCFDISLDESRDIAYDLRKDKKAYKGEYDHGPRTRRLAIIKKSSFLYAYNAMVRGEISPSQVLDIAKRRYDEYMQLQMDEDGAYGTPRINEYLFNPNYAKEKIGADDLEDLDDKFSYDDDKLRDKFKWDKVSDSLHDGKFIEEAIERIAKSSGVENYQDIINTPYAKKLLIQYSMKNGHKGITEALEEWKKDYAANKFKFTGGNIWNVQQEYCIQWYMEHGLKELFKDMSEAYNAVGVELSEEDKKQISTSNDIHWLTNTVRLLGKAIYSTEENSARRKQLEEQMDIALQRVDLIKGEEQKKKAEEEKAMKEKEKIKGELQDQIAKLKLRKEELEKNPEDITIHGVTFTRQDDETNANADNDGTAAKFGDDKKQGK